MRYINLRFTYLLTYLGGADGRLISITAELSIERVGLHGRTSSVQLLTFSYLFSFSLFSTDAIHTARLPCASCVELSSTSQFNSGP